MGAIDCAGLEDGIYGQGCRAYTECKDGVPNFVDCTPLVFNIAKQPEPGCDTMENTPPPCGVVRDCSALPDGGYPNLDDDCTSFFTCIDGVDFGTQFCNPGLVWNLPEQICNYPQNVFPPCGTRQIGDNVTDIMY